MAPVITAPGIMMVGITATAVPLWDFTAVADTVDMDTVATDTVITITITTVTTARLLLVVRMAADITAPWRVLATALTSADHMRARQSRPVAATSAVVAADVVKRNPWPCRDSEGLSPSPS